MRQSLLASLTSSSFALFPFAPTHDPALQTRGASNKILIQSGNKLPRKPAAPVKKTREAETPTQAEFLPCGTNHALFSNIPLHSCVFACTPWSPWFVASLCLILDGKNPAQRTISLASICPYLMFFLGTSIRIGAAHSEPSLVDSFV